MMYTVRYQAATGQVMEAPANDGIDVQCIMEIARCFEYRILSIIRK